MAEVLAFNSVLSLIRRVSESLEQQGEIPLLSKKVAEVIGQGLALDRCCVLLLRDEPNPGPVRELAIVSEYSPSSSPATNLHYEIAENGEIFRLLQSGNPLPLKDLISNINIGSTR